MKEIVKKTTSVKFLIITDTIIFICFFIIFRYYNHASISKAFLMSSSITLLSFIGAILVNKFPKSR